MKKTLLILFTSVFSLGSSLAMDNVKIHCEIDGKLALQVMRESFDESSEIGVIDYFGEKTYELIDGETYIQYANYTNRKIILTKEDKSILKESKHLSPENISMVREAILPERRKVKGYIDLDSGRILVAIIKPGTVVLCDEY